LNYLQIVCLHKKKIITNQQLLLFLESTGVIVWRLDVDLAACLLAARCLFATITLEIEYFCSKVSWKKTPFAYLPNKISDNHFETFIT